MGKFILGLIVGIILMPTIREINLYSTFKNGFRQFANNPLEFFKDIIEETFNIRG